MDFYKEHLEYLEEINYDLDFRDLYQYHQDMWITRAHDRFIPLKEMDTEHIVNSINFITAEGPESCFGLGALWKPKLMAELIRRGRLVEQKNRM